MITEKIAPDNLDLYAEEIEGRLFFIKKTYAFL